MTTETKSPVVAKKILTLAHRYGLSPADVVALAIHELWEKGDSEKETYQVELVKVYLEKLTELEVLRAKLEELL